MPISRWLCIALRLAGIFNMTYAAAVLVAPEAMFRLSGMAAGGQMLVNVPIWQCLGVILGLFGLGYLIAANDPQRHWLMVLVGFLAKVSAPLGVLAGAAKGELPWAMAPPSLVTDVIWWLPFGLILWQVWRQRSSDAIARHR